MHHTHQDANVLHKKYLINGTKELRSVSEVMQKKYQTAEEFLAGHQRMTNQKIKPELVRKIQETAQRISKAHNVDNFKFRAFVRGNRLQRRTKQS